MKVICKVTQKKALKELKSRAVGCDPHTLCPKCLVGRG